MFARSSCMAVETMSAGLFFVAGKKYFEEPVEIAFQEEAHSGWSSITVGLTE